MPQNLHKGSRFLTDYTEIIQKLLEANPEAAARFCDAVEHHLKLLAAHPHLGAKAGFRHAPRVRKWVPAWRERFATANPCELKVKSTNNRHFGEGDGSI